MSVTTDVDYEKDGKQVGYLQVPHSRNTSAWGRLLIPVTVLKNGQGRTALLLGGQHGGEYEGPVCLMKLARELAADQVHGRIIIIPALNLPAVQAGTRLSPLDHKDMNRIFPGKSDGTISEVIADYIQQSVLPLCDSVLDLHSGGYSLDLLPYISMHYLDDPGQTQATLSALKAFQAPVGLIMREFSGAGLLDYAVEKMGKIFLSAELGGGSRLSVSALRIAEIGTRNVLRHLGLLAGEPVTREALHEPATRLMEVPHAENYHYAPVTGIYESFFGLDAAIKRGQPIGQIHFVEHPAWEPQIVYARRSGTLIGTRGPGQAEIGDCVAVVAHEVTDLS